MIDRNYILDIVRSKDVTIDEFNYDKLTCPPIRAYFSDYDLQRLYEIATSLRYSAKPQVKYQEIDIIMKSRGFTKLSAGTNRVVYKCIENDTFVAKVAADDVGITDNPREFMSQQYLKPFCAKMFEVSANGVLAFSERVNPITNREQFLSIAEDVFTLISDYILDGTVIMADIGTNYFMNYGLRVGWGPVIIDAPYYYKLDGNKLFCNRPDPTCESGFCGGAIDYDDGFNKLVCTKCGAIYRAKELELKIKDNTIISKSYKGEYNKMKVSIKGGSKNYDVTTTVKSIEVQEPVVEEKDPITYSTDDKKRSIHVSLGHKEDREITTVNNKEIDKEKLKEVKEKVLEDTKQIIEEVNKKYEDEENTYVEETITSISEEPKLVSPVKVGNDQKSDEDNIRDILYTAAKTISAVQLQGFATSDYLMSVLKDIKFVVDTLRSTDGWIGNHEKELLDIFLSSDNIEVKSSESYNNENKLVITTDILYNTEESVRELLTTEYIVDSNIVPDEDDNDEPAAKEIEAEDSAAEFDEYVVEDDGSNSEEYYDYDDTSEIQLTGYVGFSAKTIDITTKLPNLESKSVIVIDDGSGEYLTVGSGDKLLVIDQINGLDTDEADVVSKSFVANVLKEVEEKSTELTEDTYKQSTSTNPTVNGVTTGENNG